MYEPRWLDLCKGQTFNLHGHIFELLPLCLNDEDTINHICKMLMGEKRREIGKKKFLNKVNDALTMYIEHYEATSYYQHYIDFGGKDIVLTVLEHPAILLLHSDIMLQPCLLVPVDRGYDFDELGLSNMVRDKFGFHVDTWLYSNL